MGNILAPEVEPVRDAEGGKNVREATRTIRRLVTALPAEYQNSSASVTQGFEWSPVEIG